MARKCKFALVGALDEVKHKCQAAGRLDIALPFIIDREQQAVVEEAGSRIATLMRHVPVEVREHNPTMQYLWHFHDSDPDKVSPELR